MRKLLVAMCLTLACGSALALSFDDNERLATRCTEAAKTLLSLKAQQASKKCLFALSEGSRLSSLAGDAISHNYKRVARGLLKTASTDLTMTGKLGCKQLAAISDVNAELISISHALK